MINKDMEKNLYIAEKPSVAREFAKALKLNMSSKDGLQKLINQLFF